LNHTSTQIQNQILLPSPILLSHLSANHHHIFDRHLFLHAPTNPNSPRVLTMFSTVKPVPLDNIILVMFFSSSPTWRSFTRYYFVLCQVNYYWNSSDRSNSPQRATCDLESSNGNWKLYSNCDWFFFSFFSINLSVYPFSLKSLILFVKASFPITFFE